MKILVDANLSHTWAPYLIEGGHEALHWSTIGRGQAEDSELIAWAREHDFMIMTNDLDFPRILALSRDRFPSLILLRGQPLLPSIRGAALLLALGQCAGKLTAGGIVTLDWTDGFRVRSLPIG